MDAPTEDQAERCTGPDATPDPGADPSVLLSRRAELLTERRNRSITTAQSAELEDLTSAFVERLSTGTVSLRRLTVEEDGELLGRLARMEPVHPFSDPTDPDEIRLRTEDPRRCYVIENSALPGHPLNTVWVSLGGGLPRGIHDVLADGETPLDDVARDGVARDGVELDGVGLDGVESELVTTVVFYSIWNVESGLAGIPGGSSLLTMVSERLREEFPTIDTLTTLSPIPGFRRWLSEEDPDLAERFDRGDHAESLVGTCARYLLTTDDRRLPIDSVARFHMRNGARLWRLVPEADRSRRGFERSWGVMANYRYWPEDLAANRQALAEGNPPIGASIAEIIR